MSITAIFANSPFDEEVRIDCKMLKMNTRKDGEICVLPEFNNSIFEVDDSVIDIMTGDGTIHVKMLGSAIVRFKDNVLTCFGRFEKLDEK